MGVTRLRWRVSGLLGIVLAAAQSVGLAAGLPNPLTLENALELALADHPSAQRADSDRLLAQSERAAAEAQQGTRLDLSARLRWVEPPSSSVYTERNDSAAILRLRQPLSDFGYTEARRDAADAAVEGSEWGYLDARQQLQLQVMQAFFAVLLADLAYARDNEAMAIAFLDLDKARERAELGQVSDVRLFELDSLYQQARRLRSQAVMAQRLSRIRLAAVLNRPDDLPAALVSPAERDPALPERPLADWRQEVLANNPELRRLRAELAAARAAARAADKRHGPAVYAELEAGTYERETGSTYPLAAGVFLEWPLISGGERAAGQAAARARLQAQQAELAAAELRLGELLAERWLEGEVLQARWAEVQAQGDYRELDLDRRRALYEMEVQADLGDAMVQASAVRYERARVQFDAYMTQARLAALAGRLPKRLPERSPESRGAADSAQETD